MQKYLNTLNEDDFIVFKEIESLRDKIIKKDTNVKVLDYGTGNSNENRSNQEMHQGVVKYVSTKNLCKKSAKSLNIKPYTSQFSDVLPSILPKIETIDFALWEIFSG